MHATLDVLHAALPTADHAIYVYDPAASQWQLAAPPVQVGHLAMCQRAIDLLAVQAAPIIVSDLAAHDSPLCPLEGDAGRALMAHPCWSNQILSGIVVCILDTPYAFTTDEIAALELVTVHLGLGLYPSRPTLDDGSAAHQLEIMLQNTSDTVLITDETGCINRINPAARAMFGWTPGDVECKPLYDLPFPPELRSVFNAVLQRAAGGQITFDARLDDGRVLAVSLTSLERDHQLNPTIPGHIMLIARDMTRLRDAERARLNFIHSAAHDLRNPLAVTLVALSMLSKELQETGSSVQHEIISIGLRGIERIERLIDGLLHLEHIENEAGQNHTPVDVRDLVERAIIDTRPLFDARQQSFSVALPVDPPLLSGDMYWLTRALVQLLTNAAQFTPPGGSIVLRVTTQNETICLEVEDTGPGIPPEAQANVFDPFVYAAHIDAAPEPEGVGLGLTIVKSVVERHQGRVFVSSTPRVGSIFGILLPANTEG